MAKKYGPIMSIRLGLIPTIVVSSPEFAELFLKTHDLVAKAESLIDDVMYRMVVGLKDDRFKFKPSIQEGVRLAGLFNFPDYIPYVGALDLRVKMVHVLGTVSC
ncbi:hypothetical protein IFM89_034771 [Coptis chinensis]|uniref:Uncharacterized protein n=1 Tax=Coptis chinensis TaxID=261450 RepID=A0A835LGK7_9MAGN|nr:hypothetical protein IFM89_034771 [Coptis chinensis]